MHLAYVRALPPLSNIGIIGQLYYLANTMPKHLLKRYFPSPEAVKSNPSLKALQPLFVRESIWHLNRKSVARAFFIGIFAAFLPMPFQMVVAAFVAFYLHANIAIAVGLVWISNPITIPPIFYATYVLGTWMLDIPSKEMVIELSVEWVTNEISLVWKPLVLGSLTAGLTFAIAGYVGIQLAWRAHVVSRWKKRRQQRSQ